MTAKCENCNHEYPITRHEATYSNNKRLLITSTGLNMAYRGDMNREYAVCPQCGMIEDQWQAEARDQSEEGPQQ